VNSATNPASYNGFFCEVCGQVCGGVSDGWTVCNDHVPLPKPDSPRFAWRTGERIDNETDEFRGSLEAGRKDQHEQRIIRGNRSIRLLLHR